MRRILIGLVFILPLYACSNHAPMKTVDYVDLDRFMGDWYVVANIPTFLEEGAHNAIETYTYNDDGTINTTFTFYQDGFDGELKEYNPTGFIKDTKSNALWGMQFIWPIKADYRIVYLDEDYSTTIIGRQARDYVWVMARNPYLSDQEFNQLAQFIESIGYDSNKLQRVPQKWPADTSVLTTDRSES